MALQRWYYVTYRKLLSSLRSRNRLRIVFGFARQALIAACHEGPWWQLDDWHPRCDPRIPLINRAQAQRDRGAAGRGRRPGPGCHRLARGHGFRFCRGRSANMVRDRGVL